MFEWSQGTALRAMIDGHVPGAEFDDWLEGWLFGFLQSRFKFHEPLEMLDVAVGEGNRGVYLDAFRRQGASIETAAPILIQDREAPARLKRQFDLVTVLSLEKEECLKPLDLDNPLPFLEMLFNATLLLKPGGVLLWSYLHCFPSEPAHLCSLLEPAAVYQALVRRNFKPLSPNRYGVGRVAMYHASDTLFVRQKPILSVADRHQRVTRILCGVARQGFSDRVSYLLPEETLAFPKPHHAD
jgi:hypothetical protein